MGIAHCCLRRDPQRRCSAADIAARLRSSSPSSISKAISKAQGPSTLRIPAASAKWRYILPVAAVVLVAVAVLFGPRLFNQHPEDQPAAAISSRTSYGQFVGVFRAACLRNFCGTFFGTTQRSDEVGGILGQGPRRSPRHESPVTRSRIPLRRPAARTCSGCTSAIGRPKRPLRFSSQGAVVQQIMPSVSKSARNTIHGTIKIRVKVGVDSAGNVETASFVSPGPSKYFARQAMEAAQQWKFVPGQDARTWIVRFGFTRSGTDAVLEPAKP